ncbi:MAG TPA: hypothetical protein VHR45_11315, partial [Thermoanaerobaculia bacterium]|nr:hypothetical protein [Thermoanaerobaculia bacterium]
IDTEIRPHSGKRHKYPPYATAQLGHPATPRLQPDNLTANPAAGKQIPSSFAAAKENLKLIEENDYWEPRFAERLKKALEENGQITKAFGVPARVIALLGQRERGEG